MMEYDAYGPTLQLAMLSAGNLPDPDEVERLADRARDAFARPFGPA